MSLRRPDLGDHDGFRSGHLHDAEERQNGERDPADEPEQIVEGLKSLVLPPASLEDALLNQ
jgi:hypothetical protein